MHDCLNTSSNEWFCAGDSIVQSKNAQGAALLLSIAKLMQVSEDPFLQASDAQGQW